MNAQAPWWRTPFGIVLCGFLAVTGFVLVTATRSPRSR